MFSTCLKPTQQFFFYFISIIKKEKKNKSLSHQLDVLGVCNGHVLLLVGGFSHVLSSYRISNNYASHLLVHGISKYFNNLLTNFT